MIKWIFFDVGSTIVDESDCYKSRCEYAIRESGVDRDEFMALVYESAKTSPTAIKTAAEHYNITLPKWDNSLEKLYTETFYVVDKLSDRYKLGIIANQSVGTKDRLNRWGIGKYFNVVISSAEEGCEKPDLKMFELALERANCNANEAVMIGDRLDNDVAPANRLGMKTIWIRQGFAKCQSPVSEIERPTYTVDNLREILEIIN